MLNKYVKTVQQDFLKQELKKFDNISTHFASHDDEVPEMGVHESTIMLSMQDRPSCCSIS